MGRLSRPEETCGSRGTVPGALNLDLVARGDCQLSGRFRAPPPHCRRTRPKPKTKAVCRAAMASKVLLDYSATVAECGVTCGRLEHVKSAAVDALRHLVRCATFAFLDPCAIGSSVQCAPAFLAPVPSGPQFLSSLCPCVHRLPLLLLQTELRASIGGVFDHEMAELEAVLKTERQALEAQHDERRAMIFARQAAAQAPAESQEDRCAAHIRNIDACRRDVERSQQSMDRIQFIAESPRLLADANALLEESEALSNLARPLRPAPRHVLPPQHRPSPPPPPSRMPTPTGGLKYSPSSARSSPPPPLLGVGVRDSDSEGGSMRTPAGASALDRMEGFLSALDVMREDLADPATPPGLIMSATTRRHHHAVRGPSMSGGKVQPTSTWSPSSRPWEAF